LSENYKNYQIKIVTTSPKEELNNRILTLETPINAFDKLEVKSY
jgi:hypothetical protein